MNNARTIVITSGGTREPIDAVRTIANIGRGTLGAKIANEFLAQTDVPIEKIYYLAGPECVMPKENSKIQVVNITDTDSLMSAVTDLLENVPVDYFVHSMAVSDYKVKRVFTEGQTIENENKISSAHENISIELEKTPKVIQEIKRLQPFVFLVGFKLLNNVSEETLKEVAFASLRKSRCNLVLANDLYQIRSGAPHGGMFVFPEAHFEKIAGKDQIAKELVRVSLYRGEMRRPKSSCIGEEANVPEEVFTQIKQAGSRADKQKLLPHVEGGTYGNMSIRGADNSFFITGRNVDKGNLTKDMLCEVTGAKELEDPRSYCEVFYKGKQKPSTDSAIHAAIYKDNPSFTALLHVHTDDVIYGLPLTEENPPCGSEKECILTVQGLKKADTLQLYKHGLIAGGKSLAECEEKIYAALSSFRIRKLTEETDGYKRWKEHKAKLQDFKIPALYDINSHWQVLEGDEEVAVLYHQKIGTTWQFALYGLQKTTNVAGRVISIMQELAIREGCTNLEIVTDPFCAVSDYYQEKHDFKMVEELPFIRLHRKVAK